MVKMQKRRSCFLVRLLSTKMEKKAVTQYVSRRFYMARPPFTVELLGSYKLLNDSNEPNGTTVMVSDAKYCHEEASGVSRRKPKGWVPPTGYSFTRREYVRASGVSHVSVTSNNWSIYSDCVGKSGRFNSLNHFNTIVGEDTASAESASLKQAALVAARVKLKQKHVDLGVAFAERKATSRMLGDVTTRMARSVRELRRGNFRNAARALGILSDPGKPRGSNWTNHWLQLQYGWKPLLSDVYGSADALSKRDASDWRVTTKAHRGDHDSWTYTSPKKGSAYPTGNYDAFRGVAERERGVFVRLDAIPENDLTMSFKALGLTNPLLVAWEVVPYSFVIDWVLPIGSWLDSLDALLGYSSAWYSSTHYSNTLWTDEGISYEWDYNSFIHNNWLGTKRLLKVDRTASSGVPLPAFPRFKDPRSLGHMANGLSLLAQAFKP
jgi:hypothetical protein